MAASDKPSETSPAQSVFISYSRKDKDFVHRLDDALKKRGREAWVDWEDIRPAEEFMQAIYAAIEAADAIVFVLSPISITSAACGKELAHATMHNKRLIPVVAQDVEESKVPEALAKLNWIFCRPNDDFEAEVDKLVEALDTDLDWVRAHTRLLTRAVEWEAKGKNSSFLLRGDDLRDAEHWYAQAAGNKNRQPTALQATYIIASRKAALRTQRRITSAITFGAVLALILAIYGLAARHRARLEAKRATRARDSAEKLVGYMTTDLRDKLEPFGRLYLLDDVNRKIKEYFDSVAKEDETPDNLRQRAIASENYGAVLLAQGNVTAALDNYRRASAITDNLLKARPRNLDCQFDAATSHDFVAAALQTQGKRAEALNEYRFGQQILNDLVQRDTGRTAWQEELSDCDNGIGDILASQGNLDEALKHYQQGLAITENLVQQATSNVVWRRNVSLSHKRIAGVRSAQGDMAEAVQNYRGSLAISEKLSEEDPGNAPQRFELAASHGLLGSALQAQGMRAEALVEYTAYKDIMERLVKRDQTNAVWQRELSVTYNKVGDMLNAQGDAAGALKSYRDNLAIAEALARRDPENAVWQRDLGVSYNKLGDALGASGQVSDALEYYRHALSIAGALSKRDPSNLLWQRDFAFSLRKTADMQRTQGDVKEALKSYREALAIAQKLFDQDPSNTDNQYELATGHSFVGTALEGLSQRTEALQEHETCRELMQRLVQRNASPAWQRDLALSYNKVGDMLGAQGEVERAEQSYRDGLEIAERLAQQDPSNVIWQRDLSLNYQRLGFLQVNQGDASAALESYRRSLAVLENLSSLYPDNVSWDADMVWIYWNVGKALLKVDPPDRHEAQVMMEKANAKITRMKDYSNLTTEMQAWNKAIQSDLSRLKTQRE